MAANHPLRGRSAELGVALRALRSARQGPSAVLLVRGEPGIGKTAFVQALVEQAGRLGYMTRTGSAREPDDITPLGSLGPVLRSGAEPLITAADFLALAPLTGQPLWLAERLAELLAARTADEPLLVVLDDAQWADPLSSFVLRILVARLATGPIGWVLATRDAPGGPADQLAAAADEAGLPVRWIELAPLSGDAVLEVAADRLGRPADAELAERLAGTGGVPFLAVQVIEGLLAPGGLTVGVRRRMAETSDRCRALLRAGAVLGRSFTLDDAAGLLGEPVARLTDPLDEAIRAGLFTDDGSHVTFRHDLLRRAVYEDVPPSARTAMHRTVVDLVLGAGRPYAEAAPHVLATAVPGDARAVGVLRRAARELVGTMAITAVALIRRAFELVDEGDPARGEVGREVVDILVRARHYEEALVFADRLLRGRLEPDVVAAVELLPAPWLFASGRLAELAERTADDRAGAASPALRARVAAYRAVAGGREVDAEGAEPVVTAVALAAAAGRAESSGDHPAALELYVKAAAAAEGAWPAAGCPMPVLLSLHAAVARAHLDDIAAARGWLAGAAAADSWEAPKLAWLRAHLELGEGRIDAAAAAAGQALRLMEELYDHVLDPQVRSVLVEVALLRGDLPEARAQLAEAELRGGPMPLPRALIADAEGDPSAGAELAGAALEQPLVWRDDLLIQALCSARRAGDGAAVRAAGEALAGLAARNPGVVSAEGAAALAEGRLGAAVEALGKGRRPLLLARALEEYGRTALEDGAREDGIAALDQARDDYAELGAPAAATRVQRLLQSAGVRRRRWSAVPRRPETGWDALTAMERRVALLVADGHTNRSAAAELVVSASTVSTHLRAVFAKLGVNSRVQLTRLVLARTGGGPDR